MRSSRSLARVGTNAATRCVGVTPSSFCRRRTSASRSPCARVSFGTSGNANGEVAVASLAAEDSDAASHGFGSTRRGAITCVGRNASCCALILSVWLILNERERPLWPPCLCSFPPGLTVEAFAFALASAFARAMFALEYSDSSSDDEDESEDDAVPEAARAFRSRRTRSFSSSCAASTFLLSSRVSACTRSCSARRSRSRSRSLCRFSSCFLRAASSPAMPPCSARRPPYISRSTSATSCALVLSTSAVPSGGSDSGAAIRPDASFPSAASSSTTPRRSSSCASAGVEASASRTTRARCATRRFAAASRRANSKYVASRSTLVRRMSAAASEGGSSIARVDRSSGRGV